MTDKAPYPTDYDPRDWLTAREIVDAGWFRDADHVYHRAHRDGWRKLGRHKPSMYFAADVARTLALIHKE